MWPDYVRTMTDRTPFSFPFEGPLSLIVEARDATDAAAAARMEAFLEEGAEAGWLADATVATSVAQARALWALRDEGPAAYPQIFAAHVAFDVSVPSAQIVEGARRLAEAVPAGNGLHPLTYGHLGDQNLHFVVGADRPVPASEKAAIEQAVYAVVTALGGAISAEHGIGQLKKPYLSMTRGPLALEIMAGLKALLDPAGILNPGRVID
jgi:FAD/FMN-containing dehydrogenase